MKTNTTSPKYINVVIAESLGWKYLSHKSFQWVSPEGNISEEVPNFNGSLDAIVPVIRNDPDCWTIFTELAALVSADFPAATATAAEWSFAYLKTKGLLAHPILQTPPQENQSHE